MCPYYSETCIRRNRMGPKIFSTMDKFPPLYKINNTDSSGRDYRICSHWANFRLIQVPPYTNFTVHLKAQTIRDHSGMCSYCVSKRRLWETTAVCALTASQSGDYERLHRYVLLLRLKAQTMRDHSGMCCWLPVCYSHPSHVLVTIQ
jgi:hypothetical protein